MAVTQPETVPELVLAAGGGAFGALISDIDVGTSGSHRDADKIVMLSAVVLLAVLALDCFFHTGVIEQVVRNSGYGRIIAGILLFICICAFGKEQPHRSFMHFFWHWPSCVSPLGWCGKRRWFPLRRDFSPIWQRMYATRKRCDFCTRLREGYPWDCSTRMAWQIRSFSWRDARRPHWRWDYLQSGYSGGDPGGPLPKIFEEVREHD